MFPNVDPQKIAKVQETTGKIRGVITADYKARTISLQLDSGDETALKALPSLIESFTQGLAQQLSTFFAIRGKIVEKNKPNS